MTTTVKRITKTTKKNNILPTASDAVLEEVLNDDAAPPAPVSVFEGRVEVTDLTFKVIDNAIKEFACKCVRKLSNKYGFNVDEALDTLRLDKKVLARKEMKKKEKTDKAPAKACPFPLPFVADKVNPDLCGGLSYTRGLFTQCTRKRTASAKYCKKCEEEAQTTVTGKPVCGTVTDRLQCGLYEYKDSRGRPARSYVELLKSLSIDVNKVREMCPYIPEEHFQERIVEKAPRKPRQQPAPKQSGDVFEPLHGEEETEAEQQPKKRGRAKMSDEEKAAKKQARDAEKAAAKVAKEEVTNTKEKEKDDEVIRVRKVVIQGQTYKWNPQSKVIYNMDNIECGTYDDETKQVEWMDEDDEVDEEEEEEEEENEDY